MRLIKKLTICGLASTMLCASVSAQVGVDFLQTSVSGTPNSDGSCTVDYRIRGKNSGSVPLVGSALAIGLGYSFSEQINQPGQLLPNATMSMSGNFIISPAQNHQNTIVRAVITGVSTAGDPVKYYETSVWNDCRRQSR